MQSYEVERLGPKLDPEQPMHELAALYREIFGDEPWEEWKKCPVCGRKWGFRDAVRLEEMNFMHWDCDGRGTKQPLQDFWPHKDVWAKIVGEVSERASAWIVKEEYMGRRYPQAPLPLVGFGWGYPMSPDALQSLLELPQDVAGTLRGRFSDGEIAYMSDFGVERHHRRQGLMKRMYLSMLGDFRRQGLKIGAIRTKTRPPSNSHHWFTRLGFEVVAEYGDEDGRVLIAGTLVEEPN